MPSDLFITFFAIVAVYALVGWARRRPPWAISVKKDYGNSNLVLLFILVASSSGV